MAIYVHNWLILTNISNAKANMAILAFEYRNWKKNRDKDIKKKKVKCFFCAAAQLKYCRGFERA